jgi:hypothetical protein
MSDTQRSPSWRYPKRNVVLCNDDLNDPDYAHLNMLIRITIRRNNSELYVHKCNGNALSAHPSS